MWERIGTTILRRPGRTLLAAAVVAVALAAGVRGLEFSTSQDTLVTSTSKVFRENTRYQNRFGGETVLVLLTGDPVKLFSPANIGKLQQLEGQLRSTRNVDTVVGPYNAIAYAKDQLAAAPQLILQAAARAPDKAAATKRIAVENERLASAGPQVLTNPAFVRFLMFDANGNVRPSLQANFPDKGHSLFVVRIKGNASIDVQARVYKDVKRIVAGYHFAGYQSLATGTPALLDAINSYLQGGMATLALIAVVVMVVVLGLAFAVRLRLLPLGVVAVGSAAALGTAGWIGIPLTLVTISGLPIFIGLGVDFAIQVQNRYVEHRNRGEDAAVAATAAVRHMAPPLLVAMVAGAAGFLALRFSGVPMIRDFGLLLCLGVVILVVGGIVLPSTILALADRKRPAAAAGAADKPGVVERSVRQATTLGRKTVLAVLAAGVCVAAVGFAVERRTPIESEAEKWVSPTSSQIKDLEHLRDATGFSTELGVMVEAPDVTSDAVTAWIDRFENAQLTKHKGKLLQVSSMTGIAADVVGVTPTANDVRTLLALAPRDIARSLVSADRHSANLAFPIAHITLTQEGQVADAMKADLRGDLAPPPGVSVTPSGLMIIGVTLTRNLEAGRSTLTLAALGFVAAWLLVRGRFRIRSLLPLVPVAVAVGVASFVLWAFGLTLTPLTTVAAPLVIAVATEFTVLLEARYAEERRNGASPEEACRTGLPRIGRAFVASGITLIAGFAVLAASPMPLLRDFGIVVAVDVLVALLSALVIMPPLLRWTDPKASVLAGPPAEPHAAAHKRAPEAART